MVDMPLQLLFILHRGQVPGLLVLKIDKRADSGGDPHHATDTLRLFACNILQVHTGIFLKINGVILYGIAEIADRRVSGEGVL